MSGRAFDQTVRPGRKKTKQATGEWRWQMKKANGKTDGARQRTTPTNKASVDVVEASLSALSGMMLVQTCLSVALSQLPEMDALSSLERRSLETHLQSALSETVNLMLSIAVPVRMSKRGYKALKLTTVIDAAQKLDFAELQVNCEGALQALYR